MTVEITQENSPLISCVNSIDSWKELSDYLQNSSIGVSFKLKQKALSYALVGNELYKRFSNRALLKCLDKSESYIVMGVVHEGYVVPIELDQ